MSSATTDARAPASAMAWLQRLGRSLMLPIAVLVPASLLLRFGQDDMLGKDGLGLTGVSSVAGAAGAALFNFLPLLFAIGVAIGFARRSDGSTALAGAVGYLVFQQVSMTMFSQSTIKDRVWITSPDGPVEGVVNFGNPLSSPTGVLGGLVMGIVAAYLWQRFHRTKLPTWLAFFGGRRLVPILTAIAGMLLGVVFGLLWPVIGEGIRDFGEWITSAGAVGAGVYGAINRLLIPFGLHHIINFLVWFTFGEYQGADGTVQGEIARYFAGDPDAGGMLAGFFPVLMFGLPGAALAMWRAAPPHRRQAVGGLMIAAAFTSFLTGITEPIEFAFIFAAPLLFGIHVVLTGISMAVLEATGAQLGFGFSAGALDMLLNASKSNTKGLPLILGLGVIYFVVYYAVFYYAIKLFNLPTVGREPEDDAAVDAAQAGASPEPAEAKTDDGAGGSGDDAGSDAGDDGDGDSDESEGSDESESDESESDESADSGDAASGKKEK
jgi:phosphotransferase system  glucose/maltose/N-acetylglucosamine-specific IIC component